MLYYLRESSQCLSKVCVGRAARCVALIGTRRIQRDPQFGDELTHLMVIGPILDWMVSRSK